MMNNAQAHLAVSSSSPFHGAHHLLLNSNGRRPAGRRPPLLPLAVVRCGRAQMTLTTKTTPTAAIGNVKSGMTKEATDLFHVIDYHHVEFWCADAASAAARFSFGLGVPLAAQSDLSTGNTAHASRLLRARSGSLAFLFTAPYAPQVGDAATASVPSFSADAARRFTGTHGGLAVRAVAVRVSDAAEAFARSVEAGARPAFAPADLGHGFRVAEVELSGDTVLRFVSYPEDKTDDVSFLPGFQDVLSCTGVVPDFGLKRIDHIDVNVPELAPVAGNVSGFTGFHQFWEFTHDQFRTAETGMNGVVLANDAETVLLTLVEPVYGTKRRGHVETFLEHHGGPGVQHLAIMSEDILGTLREIRARSSMGGFELLAPPPASYYDGARERAGDVLSEAQMKECQELGVRVDRGDDDGVVLQMFTKPTGDRPTLLLEFVQRIGCMDKEGGEQRAVCGGFAKRNVPDLIKAIEDHGKTLDAPA